ncbi:MAG TPA: hypothetical protein PLI09_00240 [Candidatus Hydrogenedentes bacterium]|nr:hypothetical protein [Candidatus Hydrogenedentota bacterium]
MEKERRSYPWQRRQRKILVIIFIFFVALPAALIALRKYQDIQFQKQLQAIRDAGFPATAPELANYYPTPPADQNAADLYQQSFDFKKPGPANQEFRDLEQKLGEVKKGRFAEDLHKLAEDYLAENTEKLRLLHEAAKFPACRFPLDFSKGSALELPHLSQLRASMRLLSLEAILAAEDGDMNRALDSILTAFAVTNAIRQEPLVISQLVWMACHGIACDTVRRTMDLAPFSEEQLAQLATALKNAEDPESMGRGLAGERVLALMAYEDPILITNDLDHTIHGAGTAAAALLQVTGALNRDCEYYLRMMNQMIDASRLPAYEAMPAMRQIERRLNASSSWLPSIARIQLPALTRIIEAQARDQAILRTTATSVAIERYRLLYNHLPEQINDLTPSFLESIPIDPFDGQPLHYRRLDTGYVVYSVGLNLKDDDGAEPLPRLDNRMTGDIIFRVER